MLGEEVMEAMEASGIHFDIHVIPESLEKTDEGLVMTSEDGRRFGPVDCVLWAIGREANSDTLALDASPTASTARWRAATWTTGSFRR